MPILIGFVMNSINEISKSFIKLPIIYRLFDLTVKSVLWYVKKTQIFTFISSDVFNFALEVYDSQYYFKYI